MRRFWPPAGEDTSDRDVVRDDRGRAGGGRTILDALRAMILEARRAREFGFAQLELEQGRRRLLSSYEQAVAEKGKTDSANYAAEYIRNFLTDEPFPGIQTEYDMTHAMLPGDHAGGNRRGRAKTCWRKTTARSSSRRRTRPASSCPTRPRSVRR